MSESNEAPPAAGLLTKEQITANAKLGCGYIMAFGGRVRVVELGPRGRDQLSVFSRKLIDERGAEAAREFTTAVWLMFCMVDEDGNRVWADEDLDTVSNLPGRDARRVFKVVSRLNGLDIDDEDDGGN